MAPPRRCRASGRQTAAPPAAAVWLTDMVLREAMEQFQRRCFSSQRRLSSHNRPLEARRPVGRRHMAGIMPVPQQRYRMGWYFEVLGNQNVTEWSPPTSAKARRENEQKFSLSRLKDRLFRWLENSDFDKPFLVPPDAAALDAEKEKPIATSVDSVSVVVDPRGVEFKKFREAIRAMKTVPEQALTQALVECFDSFFSRVKLGKFDLEEIPMALNPLDKVTWNHAARSLPQQTLQVLVTHHRKTLLDCLDSARKAVNREAAVRKAFDRAAAFRKAVDREAAVREAADRKAGEGVVLQKAWIKTFEEVLRLEPAMELLDLCEYIIARSTSRDASSMQHRKVNQFLWSYIAFLTRKQRIEASWISDVARFSQILQLFRSMPGTTWSPGYAKESFNPRSQYSSPRQNAVMLLMAHDASIPEHAISKQPLPQFHVWGVVTARLLASESMTHAAFEALNRKYTECANLDRRWLALTSTLIDEDRHGSFLDSLLSLQRLQGPTPLDISHIVSKALTRPQESTMRAHALRIFERFAQDPEAKLNEEWVWSGLREQLRPWRGVKHPRYKRKGVNVAAMTKVLDEVVIWYLNAPRLSERQALRGVERCVEMQQNYSGRISPSVLASLTKVVIRDLEAGEPGRSTRLANLIEKVAANQGVKEAKHCLKILKNWRQMIMEAKTKGPW